MYAAATGSGRKWYATIVFQDVSYRLVTSVYETPEAAKARADEVLEGAIKKFKGHLQDWGYQP